MMAQEHYVQTVVPALATVKLSDLMVATGLTNASCGRIRSGASAPHRRHGEVLAGLGGVEPKAILRPRCGLRTGFGRNAAAAPPPTSRLSSSKLLYHMS